MSGVDVVVSEAAVVVAGADEVVSGAVVAGADVVVSAAAVVVAGAAVVVSLDAKFWLIFAETFEFDAKIAFELFRDPTLMFDALESVPELPDDVDVELLELVGLMNGLKICQKIASAPFVCNWFDTNQLTLECANSAYLNGKSNCQHNEKNKKSHFQ